MEIEKPLVILWLDDLCIFSSCCCIQLFSLLSGCVTFASCCPKTGGQQSSWDCRVHNSIVSSPFPIQSFFTFRGFSVHFFSLCFSFQLILLPSLLLQIFMHCHSKAKVHTHKISNDAALRTNVMQRSELMTHLPSGLLFLHFFPAALHEFKCIVTLIFIPEGIKKE